MILIKGIEIYRFIARLLPLKHKWDFMIRRYLMANDPLEIPFFDKFSIVIRPNQDNMRTISDLIFEGARYLPEYKLVNRVKTMLPEDFVYVDVGSNIGTTVWLYARQAKRIVAFEPIPHLAQVIRDSIQVSKSNNIELRQVAIGETTGELSMVNSNNAIVSRSTGADTIKVKTNTLDLELINEPRIDLLKIDVEGFEWRVLQGAEVTLRNKRPRLLIEIHPANLTQFGDRAEQVLELIEKLNYRFEYYLFLPDAGKSPIQRLISRYGGRSTVFESKEAFLKDINRRSAFMVYHIYCEPI